MTGIKNGELHQMEELVDATEEKSESIDVFGFYKCIIKLTGLDRTAVERSKHGHGSKVVGIITKIFSFVTLAFMIFRAMTFLSEEGKFMSFNWSEANVFGFMGLHSVVCSFCLMGWTENGRFQKHLKRLSELKKLRIEPNETIDDYRGLRKTYLIFVFTWLVALVFPTVYNALHEKILYSGAVVPAYKFSLFPVLAVLVWLITSTCIALYSLANASMWREMDYFNQELKKACENKEPKIDHETITAFSHRQNEIIKMVKTSNEYLKSYATVGPLFCFFSLISAIYNLSFVGTVSAPYGVALFFLMFNVIFCTVFSLWPASRVQWKITETSVILMESEMFETAEDPKVYQAYRVMLDRSLSSESRIFVVNAFGINSRNLNVAMFVVPNIGPLLMMLKKLLEYNGYDVQS